MQAPLGALCCLSSYGEEQEGRGTRSSSRYGEALGKPWLTEASSGALVGQGEGRTCLEHAIIHGDSPETQLGAARPWWDRRFCPHHGWSGEVGFPWRCTNSPQGLGSLCTSRETCTKAHRDLKPAGPQAGLTPSHSSWRGGKGGIAHSGCW